MQAYEDEVSTDEKTGERKLKSLMSEALINEYPCEENSSIPPGREVR